MSWAIWTARNDLIFNDIQPSVNNVKETFTKEIKLLIFGIKSSISDIFDLWIQNMFNLYFIFYLLFFLFLFLELWLVTVDSSF